LNEPNTKIAATLYSLREYCQTEKDLDNTLKRIRGFGYEAVQISGVPLSPDKIKDITDKHGLYICASHEGLDALRNDFNSLVKKLKTWDCDFTALGFPGEAFTVEPAAAGKLIAELDGYGRRFADQGIRFGYHNHEMEFAPSGDSLFLERIYAETDKTTFFAEIDVHWVQRGGQNPAEWIRKVSGRMPVCHFKDYTIVGREPRFCEVGEGNLNWSEIIQACVETGVRWYVVEQDVPVENRDIFQSLEISYQNLKKMGVK
jgi:sugar phosphate isomerase/epimerase